jgi:hypothetical protein
MESSQQGNETAQQEQQQKEEVKPFNETPEYIAADKKVRDVADQIRQNPEDENLFTQLNEAKQERDNARIAWEQENKRIAREKQEALIVKNPAQALKEQIQQHYRTLQEGVKKGAKMKTELLTKVNDVIKKASKAGVKISTTQINSIINKVKGTNLFTAGSVSKLNTFIDNVFNDAEYGTKLSTARIVNKKLKKLASSPGKLNNIKTLAKAFATINPEDTFINQHNSIGQELLSALASATAKNYKINNFDYVENYVKQKIQEANEGLEAEQEAVEKSPDTERIPELQAQLQESLNKLKLKDLSEFNKDEKKTVNTIKKLDPKRLSEKRLI